MKSTRQQQREAKRLFRLCQVNGALDESRVRHRLSFRVKRSRVPGLSQVMRRFLLWQMMKTYHEDMRIWQSKEYLPHPVLCDGDGAIIKLRSWYRRFFDPEPRRLDVVPS